MFYHFPKILHLFSPHKQHGTEIRKQTSHYMGGTTPVSIIPEQCSTDFITPMLENKKDAICLSNKLSNFFRVLQTDDDECHKFGTNTEDMLAFMRLMHEPGINDRNMELMHSILVYVSEEDAKRDRNGLRNMIACTFEVKEWIRYNKIVDDMLGHGRAKSFQLACRLYSLYTFVNEIRRRNLPTDFLNFVSERAAQLMRGLQVFPDKTSLWFTLECLWTMISAFDGSRKTVIDNDGGRILLAVIRNNMCDPALAELCFKILSPLTMILMKRNRELYKEDDGIYIMALKCMVQHVEREDLVDAGCTILRRSIMNCSDDKRFLIRNNMNTVITLMKSQHAKNLCIETNVAQLQYILRQDSIENFRSTRSEFSPECPHRRGRSRAYWDTEGNIVRTPHAHSTGPRTSRLKSESDALHNKDLSNSVRKRRSGR